MELVQQEINVFGLSELRGVEIQDQDADIHAKADMLRIDDGFVKPLENGSEGDLVSSG